MQYIEDRRELRFIKRIDLDLSTARDKVKFDIQGDVMLVESIDGEADIYFNETEWDDYIELDKTRKIFMDFWRIFISNTIQAGKTCTILIGREGVFDGVADVASATVQNEMNTSIGNVETAIGLVKTAVDLNATFARQDILKAVMDDIKAKTDNLDSAMSTLATHIKQDLLSTIDKQDELISYYDFAWDLNAAEYLQESSIWGGPDDNPYDLYISPDGTKVYAIGNAGDEVNEFILNIPYNVGFLTSVRSFSVAAKESNPTGVTFKNDGSKMYVIGIISDRIHEYNLGTPWNISTAVWLQQSMSLDPTDTTPHSLYLNADGTKMYLQGAEFKNLIECTLSTPWDISTLTPTNTLDISSFITAVVRGGVFVSKDGYKLWMTGQNKVMEFSLTTAWDISTAIVTKGLDVTTYGAGVNGIWWKPDGLTLFLGCDGVPEVLAQYDL